MKFTPSKIPLMSKGTGNVSPDCPLFSKSWGSTSPLLGIVPEIGLMPYGTCSKVNQRTTASKAAWQKADWEMVPTTPWWQTQKWNQTVPCPAGQSRQWLQIQFLLFSVKCDPNLGTTVSKYTLVWSQRRGFHPKAPKGKIQRAYSPQQLQYLKITHSLLHF